PITHTSRYAASTRVTSRRAGNAKNQQYLNTCGMSIVRRAMDTQIEKLLVSEYHHAYGTHMSRLTRAESPAHTREQLVTTARELFLAHGYTATSLERVAETAGFSKGAVYSNFRNKDGLCLAVLDAIHEEQAEGVNAALSATSTLDELLVALR